MATNTFSSLASHLRSHNLNLDLSLGTHRIPNITRIPPATLALAAAAAAVGIASAPALIARAARSYRDYLALGPGGAPPSVLGWAAQGLLQVFAWRDTRDPSPFLGDPSRRGPYGPHGTRGFLGEGRGGGWSVPPRRREGEGDGEGDGRPVVPGPVAPQRQTTQQGGEGTRARMLAHLEALAGLNPGLLVMRPSGLEGAGTPALCLAGGGEGVELAHVHGEASSHLTVSLADADALVRGGWAERHKLSGVWGVIPLSYLLVYAPRDEAELGFWKEVVGAGVRFVCAGMAREVAFE